MRLRWHHVDYYALASMKQQRKQDRRTLPCPKIVDGEDIALPDDIPVALFQLLANDSKNLSHGVDFSELSATILPKAAAASILSQFLPQKQVVSKTSSRTIEWMLDSNELNDAEPITPLMANLEEPLLQDTDFQNVRRAEEDAEPIAMESAPSREHLVSLLDLETACNSSTSSKSGKPHKMDKFCPMDPPCILDDPINPGHSMTDPSTIMKKMDLMKPSEDAMSGLLNSRTNMMSLLGPGRMAVDQVKPTYTETLCKVLEEPSTIVRDSAKSEAVPLLDVPFPSLSQSPMGEKLAVELIHKEKSLRLEALPSLSVSMKDFNELVVAPQLTFNCGGIRSLPVPLLQQDELQGDGNLLPVTAFLSLSESLKANLTMASRARDFLYLDWHLSQDFKSCTSSNCSNAGCKLSFQKVRLLQSEAPQSDLIFSLIEDRMQSIPAQMVSEFEQKMVLPSALVQMVDSVSTSPAVAPLFSTSPHASCVAIAAQSPSQPLYGIRVAHLFLEQGLETASIAHLAPSFKRTREALASAFELVEGGATVDHPKLSMLTSLLRAHKKTYQLDSKGNAASTGSANVLIVADNMAFFTMYKLLGTCQFQPFQIGRSGALSGMDGRGIPKGNWEMVQGKVNEALEISDCLLVSPKPRLHKLQRSEPEEPEDRYDEIAIAQESERHAASIGMNAALYTTIEAPELVTEPNEWRQEQHLSRHYSVGVPEKKKAAVEYKRTVIVNTRDQFDPIVLRRRQLYDKILQLEESGIQIIERDLVAPAEIVLNASTSLIIYNPQRLKEVQKLAAMDGLPSSSLMTVCLEAVVETHLKALSFAYQTCFLVFEGTDAYLTQIKCNVDDLYAGGAALDLDVQCFFSSSETSTESLILSLLSSAASPSPAKQSGSEPSDTQPFRTPLPESESPQEAFLCRFPSLNPLSAHIIMTSGFPLPVFMCLHHEQQASATVPRGLPSRSLSLFQAQCEHKTTPRQGPAHIHMPVQGSRNSPPSEGNLPMYPSDMRQTSDRGHLQMRPGAIHLLDRRPQKLKPCGVRSFPSAFEIEQADAAPLLGDEDYYRNHMSQARMTDSPSSHYSASPASSTYFQGASESEPSVAPSASSGVRSALQGWMSRRQSAGHQSNPTGSSSFHSEVPPAGTRGNPYGARSSFPQLSRYSAPGTRSDDHHYPSGHVPHQAQPGRPDYYQQQQQQGLSNTQYYRSQQQQFQSSPSHDRWASPPAPPQTNRQFRGREQSTNQRVCTSLFQDDSARRREEADASLQKFRHTGSKIPKHVMLKRKLQGVQSSDQRGSSSSRAEDSRLSWTPSDKRAREILACERAEGDGKQCKLVWKKPAGLSLLQ
ncbi:unnamed protein product [Closterium sp. Yama58-4]|nr:unnamed protein product [Closterium sp. Yama58-4]